MNAQAINTEARLPALAWYLSVRLGGMTLILLDALFYQYWGDPRSVAGVLNLLYLLLAVSYLQALVSAILLKLKRYVAYLVEFQIGWDLLFATFLVFFTGGPGSIFSFVFLLVIISSSLFLNRRSTFYIAGLAAVVYTATVFAYNLFYGQNSVTAGLGPTFVSSFFHGLAFIITAFLCSTLARRWQHSLKEISRKAIDFDELEKLNHTIMAHIGSGLSLVNAEGRILSFNRAASQITGLSLEEVYGQPFALFFTDMHLLTAEGAEVPRHEAQFRSPAGRAMYLGYATTVIEGRSDADRQILVTFQDLTEFKQMEERLARVDRLAAVGQLASGMAHEIRNPLASISGSVQLLLEREALSERGSRLMTIIEREADRLSGLLGEFLDYARPATPAIKATNVAAIIDEVIDLLQNEAKDPLLTFQKEYSPHCRLSVDPAQFRQVVLNLLVNARDAVQGQGTLRVKIDDGQTVWIEDSGPGIANDMRTTIFDPFFTTKEKGTGLGLSLVYTIMQSHGGTIDVGNSDLGGAAFQLRFSSKA